MREKEGERLRWISEIKARWHSQIALIASKLYVRAWWRIIVLKDVNNCVTNWRRKLHEEVEERVVRFRTVGDMSCTAAVLSTASDINSVVQEIRESSISERGARIDDKRSEAAMEKRKQQGYF